MLRTPKIPIISGIELTADQWQTLKNGGFMYLENRINNDTKTQFSSYVFFNEEKNQVFL